MAEINKDTVAKLAKLANIALSSEEIDEMSTELSAILGFVETLQAVDVDDVAPTYQVTGLQDAFRADEIDPLTIPRDELLANAPEQHDGYIKVRRVL